MVLNTELFNGLTPSRVTCYTETHFLDQSLCTQNTADTARRKKFYAVDLKRQFLLTLSLA
jgi:hypothetical protein